MGLTVKRWVRGNWKAQRTAERPLAVQGDLSWLEHHMLDALGDRQLADLATDEGTAAVHAWAKSLKTRLAQRDGKPLAPNSVKNIYSISRVMFDDAVEAGHLSRNPLATFRARKHLPQKADKDETWRAKAGFELADVAALTSDVRLEAWRRVVNSLAFTSGARTGELIELRFSDVTDSYKGGMGRIVISRAWNSRSGVVKGTKTSCVRLIPLHPYTARVLNEWRAVGFRAWTGRDPGAADLIIPRSDGRHWTNTLLGKAFHADLAVLGLSEQRQYESRSTFRSLLLGRDVPKDIVDQMTHPAPRDAADLYRRPELLWPAMCAAVLKLDHPSWHPDPPAQPQPVHRVLEGATGAPIVDLAVARGQARSGGVYGTRTPAFAACDVVAPSPAAAGDHGSPTPDWFRSPDAPASLPDVPGEQLVEALFEAEAWALDARLARAEAV